MINSITKSFKCHGAKNISTPLFELREVLVKSGIYGEDFKFIYDLGWEEDEFLSLRSDLMVIYIISKLIL